MNDSPKSDDTNIAKNPYVLWVAIASMGGFNFFAMEQKSTDYLRKSDADMIKVEIGYELNSIRKEVDNAFETEAASDQRFHVSMQKLHDSDTELMQKMEDLERECKK